MLLQADQVVYDSDSQTVSAVGHVEIVDGVRILDADNVTYDENSDKVTASGHVSVTDEKGNVAFADHVVLTDRMRDGALNGFGALIGKNGRLAATDAQRIQDRLVIANHAVYSPCKICVQKGQRNPLWQVKSERVVLDQVNHRIHFTDATVDVLGVPLLYTPYLTEPDPTVKYASGFLAPDAGTLTKIGYFVRLPVYLALGDTSGLTVQPEFTTQGGEMVEAEYRQRWNNSGMWLQASGTYNSNGGLGGAPGTQDYDHLFGAGRFALERHLAHRLRHRAHQQCRLYAALRHLLSRPAGQRSVRRGRERPQPFRAHRLLFPGPALHRCRRPHSLCAAHASITATSRWKISWAASSDWISTALPLPAAPAATNSA